MGLEVISNAADGIYRVLPDISLVIAVEIDGIAAVTAGHELPIAHRTSIGALQHQWIHSLIASQNQKVLQFLGKELRSTGVINRKRREGIDDPVTTCNPAVIGFDTNDGNDNLCGDACFFFGSLQCIPVFLVKLNSLFLTLFVKKNLPILIPGLGLFRRTGHGIQNGLLTTGIFENGV